jgi:hypothetical protein
VGDAKAKLKCRYCGCTELRACNVGGDPCFWVVPPGYHGRKGVCSNPTCVNRFHAEEPEEELNLASDLAVPPDGEIPSLGSCCCCRGTADVRNVVMLPHKGAVAGKGWGCVVCGLAWDGASYVCCDSCLEAERKPTLAVVGYPSEHMREPIEAVYARPAHAHNMEFHRGEDGCE